MNDQWLVIPFVPINRAYLCGVYAFLTTQKAKKKSWTCNHKNKKSRYRELQPYLSQNFHPVNGAMVFLAP